VNAFLGAHLARLRSRCGVEQKRGDEIEWTMEIRSLSRE